MMTSRVNEIIASMNSFSEEKYKKNEMLTEMFALQRDVVELAFKDENVSTDDLKIWDVENYLEQLNQDLGNIADDELQRFKKGSMTLCNMIKAEVSGSRGEARAFRTLQYIQSKNIVLKNIELNDGEQHTELDAVVITPNVVTIIEVKNTSKNIFIDENGDYYRTGEYLRWDCNIANKVALKEELLKKALSDDGIEDVLIRSIVVFTDNRIEVQNKNSEIRTCFVSQLAHIIDEFKSDTFMSDADTEHIEEAINKAKFEVAYPLRFDVAQYKMDFAILMDTLENASAKVEEPEHESEQEVVIEKKSIWTVFKDYFKSQYAGCIGRVVTPVATTLISNLSFNAFSKGGVRI